MSAQNFTEYQQSIDSPNNHQYQSATAVNTARNEAQNELISTKIDENPQKIVENSDKNDEKQQKIVENSVNMKEIGGKMMNHSERNEIVGNAAKRREKYE